MSRGQEIENKAFTYLNNKFGKYAEFKHEGKSNSTVSDIKVVDNNAGNKSFWIEVKSQKAQSGQFVLDQDVKKQKFIFKDSNKSDPNNKNTIKIIKHMNENFSSYYIDDNDAKKETAYKEINMPNGPTIFANWIIDHYTELGAKFIVFPSKKDKNVFNIIELSDISRYFNITAKYRVKRSGSSNIGKTKVKDVQDYLNSQKNGLYIDDFEEINGSKKRLVAISNHDLMNYNYTDVTQMEDKYELYFSNDTSIVKNKKNKFEVEKLSNTFNKNVIFSLSLKSDDNGLKDENFINYIKIFFI